jgi:hypothetical protein
MTRRSLLGLLLIGMLLASCGGQPAAAEATPDMNLTVAAGAETMVAAVFQTQTAIAPPATNTAPPTVTSLPTVTASTPLTLPTAAATQAILFAASPTPTGTFYTSTPLSSSLAAGCRNLRLINSWTEPDDPFRPGTEFRQFWQVENNGSCDWLFVFEVVHASGDRMNGSSTRLSKKIEPGKWTTLSVDLDAPIDNGTYNATWRFSDGGTLFGASLPVSIKVQRNPDPTATPNATQTIQSAAQQTSAAAAQATAVQAGINTAVAGTATAQSVNATATCVAQAATPPVAPCQ